MNRTDREIERLCLDVVLLDGEQDEAPDLSDMATRAKAILAKRDEERRHSKLARKAKARSLSLPGKTKEQRKAERREHIAEVRAEAFAVWEGWCVPCVYEASMDNAVLPATDLHHLCSGSGTRQAEERVGTVLPVCRVHHDKLHRGDVAALRSVVHIARDPGAQIEDIARRAVERRLEKVESFAARRTT